MKCLRFAFVTALLLIVALPWATAAGTKEAASTEKVTLTYWHTYGDAEAPFFREKVLPLFTQKYPNITVNDVRQEGGQYNQLIVTAMGTGQLPDVARTDIVLVPGYAKQGALVALDGLSGFNALKNSVFPATLATNFFKGNYYGLPLDTNCKAAVVNMDNLGKLGLTNVPVTLDELVQASKTKRPGVYTISVSGTGGWDMLPWFWLFGGTATNSTYTKASGYLDSAKSIDALTQLVALHTAKVLTVRDIDGTPDAWQGINEGDFVTFYDGPWFFAANADWKAKHIVPALIPTVNGKSSSVVGGEDIAMFSTSKHQKEAWLFMQFLLSPEVQSLMAQVGQMPVVRSVAQSDTFKSDEVWQVYLKQMDLAQPRIPSPQYSAIDTILSDMFTSVMRGDSQPADALHKAAGLIDTELAK